METRGYPIYLGEQNTEQFTVETLVNGQSIKVQPIHDPFIRTTVLLCGIGHAWRALFGGIKVQIVVNATEGAQRAIMTLNPVELQQDTEQILEDRRVTRETGSTIGYCVEGPAR